MKKLWIASLFFLNCLNAFAADYYVRPQGTCTSSCTTWTNAYGALPTTLERGSTYYVADGDNSSYGSYTFTGSGTGVITIKKATADSHGTSTGWVNSYGDGVATFGTLTFNNTGYITIDGQQERGIRIPHNSDCTQSMVIYNGETINLRNIEIVGPGQSHKYAKCNGETAGIYMPAGNYITKNLTLHNVDIHDTSALMWVGNSDNMTIQYSELYNSGSGNEDDGVPNSGNFMHSNMIYIDKTSNFTFRYNNVYNYLSTGLYAAYQENSYPGWKIYGNIVHDSMPGFMSRPVGALIYNNTFYKAGRLGNLLDLRFALTGSQLHNNLIIESGTLDTSGISAANNSNNIQSSSAAATTFLSTVSSSPDYLRLKAGASAINSGKSLAADYSLDADGRTRGTGGGWDVGAFEFGTSNSAAPGTPGNLRQVN